MPVGASVACVAGLLTAVVGGGGSTAPVLLPGLVCGLALGTVATGIQQGWLSHSRPDEAFTLYEGGLVHSYAGQSRAVSWDEIVKVTDEGRSNALYRALGAEVRYRIKLRSAVGGRRVVLVTGITEDARRLGEIVQRAVRGTHPRPDAP